ncbi:LysR family transcriptional regulator [Serratia marcescens]|uniref:SmeR transcriptional regulator n=5 Tax=Serratia marcescens TaxID=615 RepID=M4T1Q9_SERMA|nr:MULTISPECIES: LysR family transcriptional regulator [Serratia]AGH62547.1 SmeR transcriptional regulator [Serratia marcescens]AGZ03782.1 SmeR transcriptional regulator [Serratia marcescens]AGZ03821.1 SmeR transcriptional regulator [Serratia marcescens]AGZ03856.1 SmeR transcriptional regulator [Serratia marcescens]AVN35091.1 LysR family transcriptional regulator [Serratia marcescens]
MKNRIPLNALRAFEASARYLNFTKAGLELHVSQAAVSQHVRTLEAILGVNLFKRLPRGLQLTEEGLHLLPMINEAFSIMGSALERFHEGKIREVITVAVVGTFAVGWLLPRLSGFTKSYPWIDIRVITHNNVINLAAEGIDAAIRFGHGFWQSTENYKLFSAPHTVLCPPNVAKKLTTPEDMKDYRLLRTYRKEEWSSWFKAANLKPWPVTGPIFDSSRHMVDAAKICGDIALAPYKMFIHEIENGSLVKPFDIEVDLGGYWLTILKSRSNIELNNALNIFKTWLLNASHSI